MPGADELAFQLAAVARRLRETGDEGLARELQQEISRAGGPVKKRIRAGLKPHLPDRYAGVLDADLSLTQRSSTDTDGARVSIYASPKTRKRKLQLLEAGFINHPVYAQGLRSTWRWSNGQTGGMVPGWFSGPVDEAAPDFRAAAERALDNAIEKAVHG